MKNSLSIQYALMCLQALDDLAEIPCSAAELSRACGVPLPECVSVLQKLTSAGWLEKVEDDKVVLTHPLSELTAFDILTALSTPVKKVPPFKMRVGPHRGPVVRKTLEAIAWSQAMDVYPSENGPKRT